MQWAEPTRQKMITQQGQCSASSSMLSVLSRATHDGCWPPEFCRKALSQLREWVELSSAQRSPFPAQGKSKNGADRNHANPEGIGPQRSEERGQRGLILLKACSPSHSSTTVN